MLLACFYEEMTTVFPYKWQQTFVLCKTKAFVPQKIEASISKSIRHTSSYFLNNH